MLARLVLLIGQTAAGPSPDVEGVIAGTVVNASRGGQPAGGTHVVLQVYGDGGFAPFRETATDAHGQFRFGRLPVGGDYVYLVGADRDGVYQPGPRLQILAHRPCARVELKVYDAVASPSPLVIRRQEILLCPGAGAVHVTESLLIENPANTCFVGKSPREGDEPVTLRLSIPSDFDRATFHEEFYGRRFSLAEGALVTGIPWPPGQREIKFTYVLRNDKKDFPWRRPLDLPCERLRLRVQTDDPRHVACNLPAGPGSGDGEVVFESAGELPAGHVVRVDLGRLPLGFMAYARWAALGVMAVLVAGVGLVTARRRRSKARLTGGTETPASVARPG